MEINFDPRARKRPVNLTLNEDLVLKAKAMTGNLSGVVESLLAEFVAHERRQRIAKADELTATIALWNDFDAKLSSISDEYSTL
jgi:antitoxin CcdA